MIKSIADSLYLTQRLKKFKKIDLINLILFIAVDLQGSDKEKIINNNLEYLQELTEAKKDFDKFYRKCMNGVKN